MAEHNELGRWGEDYATIWLRDKGYVIVERDWHSKHRDKEGNPNLGKHVQALIYAHVLGREPYLLDQLGIAPCGDLPAVVGALYLSYRRGNTMRGTFVTEELSEEQFPTLVGKDCGRSAKDLVTLLERLEASVAEEVVERIRAGVVDPAPRTDDACRYCPVTGCPRRR